MLTKIWCIMFVFSVRMLIIMNRFMYPSFCSKHVVAGTNFALEPVSRSPRKTYEVPVLVDEAVAHGVAYSRFQATPMDVVPGLYTLVPWFLIQCEVQSRAQAFGLTMDFHEFHNS